MIRLGALALAAFCTGCTALDSAEVQSCERNVISQLKSPSSYKRIATHSWDDDISLADLQKSYLGSSILPHESQMLSDIRGKRVAVRHTSIEYDADNSYGAAIRETTYCNFVVVDGQPYRPTNPYTQKYDAHLDDMIADRQTDSVPNELYEERSYDAAGSTDPFASMGLTLPPY